MARKKMDGWMDKKYMKKIDGWLNGKKYMKKWMVGWIIKIYEK